MAVTRHVIPGSDGARSVLEAGRDVVGFRPKMEVFAPRCKGCPLGVWLKPENFRPRELAISEVVIYETKPGPTQRSNPAGEFGSR